MDWWADKSAVAAINRALREVRRRFWYTLVHVLKFIIALSFHDLPLISTLLYGKLVSKYKDDGGTNICQRRSFPVSLCGVVILNKYTLVCDIYH